MLYSSTSFGQELRESEIVDKWKLAKHASGNEQENKSSNTRIARPEFLDRSIFIGHSEFSDCHFINESNKIVTNNGYRKR